MSIRKIKIQDVDTLRECLVSVYAEQDHLTLAQWSIDIANRIIEISGLKKEDYPEIEQSFDINRSWQTGQARMHDVRQAGFVIHSIAREQSDDLMKNVFRTIGQAVSSAHMQEHAMVSSDYAIKVINLKFPQDIARVEIERAWQITHLRHLALGRCKLQF